MASVLGVTKCTDKGDDDANGTFRKVVVCIDEAELGGSKDDESSILLLAHRACVEQSSHQEAVKSGAEQKANIDASAAKAIVLK
jgi:hypothetical protein